MLSKKKIAFNYLEKSILRMFGKNASRKNCAINSLNEI